VQHTRITVKLLYFEISYVNFCAFYIHDLKPKKIEYKISQLQVFSSTGTQILTHCQHKESLQNYKQLKQTFFSASSDLVLGKLSM